MSRTTINLSAPEAAGAYLAVQALAKATGIPASLRYALAGLTRSLEGAYKDLAEGQVAAIQRHAITGEDGALVPRTDAEGQPIPNSFRFASEESARLFREEVGELNHQEATIEYTPIPIERYLERLDEHGVEIPEGVFETLLPFFAAEAGSE